MSKKVLLNMELANEADIHRAIIFAVVADALLTNITAVEDGGRHVWCQNCWCVCLSNKEIAEALAGYYSEIAISEALDWLCVWGYLKEGVFTTESGEKRSMWTLADKGCAFVPWSSVDAVRQVLTTECRMAMK